MLFIVDILFILLLVLILSLHSHKLSFAGMEKLSQKLRGVNSRVDLSCITLRPSPLLKKNFCIGNL